MPIFTKEHHKAIAGAMFEAKKDVKMSKNPMRALQWSEGVIALANLFREDDPNFSTSDFYLTCLGGQPHDKP